MNKSRLLDLLYLIALGVYVLAGVPLAPFHGDEPMQISMSRDYATAILEGRWSDLLTQPPYDIDTDAHLRLINGTVNRYAIGVAWQIAGYTAADLPPRPGWDWGLSYADGVATGHRPGAAALNAARLPSALFTMLSVGVMFWIGRQIGGRPAAYIAAALYALNPALLLNGRRALQEGSMLCFGLLTVGIAAWLSRRDRPPWWAWVALTLAGALTLASKHSGGVFVAAAWGWIALSAVTRPRTSVPITGAFPLRHLAGILAALTCAGMATLALFVALSPALWNDPPARVGNLLEERARLLDIQVSIDPLAPLSFGDRIAAILLQPVIRPAMYYELATWADVDAINAESAAYSASAWYGHPNGVIGVAIMALAGVGLVAALREGRRFGGLLLWLGVTALMLLVNPLPWQRYYLPLIPVIAALAGLAAAQLVSPRR